MTFTETIYNKIHNLNHINTDEFSVDWLGQSRSYYSANKARGLEASNAVIVQLMNKLTIHKQGIENRTDNPVLLKAANEYGNITNEIATEVAKRSVKANIANKQVKEILYKVVNEINHQAFPSAPPILIGF